MEHKSFVGYIYAALSSSTFGLAPFFTLSLIGRGMSSFEVLAYRWGVAFLFLLLLGLLAEESFRVGRECWLAVLILCMLRAATSFSLIVAYQCIASGVASTIHFMYPLAVSVVMMFVFGEKKSSAVLFAVAVALVGTGLLSSGEFGGSGENTVLGIVAALCSVFFYGGYIIGVRKSRAVSIPPAVLTCCIMGLGTVFFCVGGLCTSGIRLVTDGTAWMNIIGLALPATAISNITLVKAVKYIGPTLTSVFGALEPLTAVAVGCTVFDERFAVTSTVGMVLVLVAVVVVVCYGSKSASA